MKDSNGIKWIIASDIHGSALYCRQLLERFEKEGADRLLLLGDILYHGPRNDLPDGYAPKEVIELLNNFNKGVHEIYCVRGNCDAQVDQMVLEFPIMAEYCILQMGKYMVYATHGHNFGENNPPKLNKGNILLCGHTHISKCTEYDNYIYMNPGSVSIPKENSHHGYMIYEQNQFVWKDLMGREIMKY